MEIGSFIELQFEQGREWYTEVNHNKGCEIARLNSGRVAIYHALRCFECSEIYIPYYQCDTVRTFLLKKGICINYYNITNEFEPILEDQKPLTAVLIVNYYGIMKKSRMENLAKKFKNVIIDNSQAFFAEPLVNCMNVYSARKFVGVPDGAYVLGKNASKYLQEYKQGFSSDTALFLLQRYEYGCEGRAYESKMANESRIDSEDILKMSKLTQSILDGTNYSFIKKKRKKNFSYACELFDGINKLKVDRFVDKNVIPMVYPLVVENDELLKKLLEAKHFQGHWWSYLLAEMSTNSFEYWISRYMIPITTDQRYGRKELEYIRGLID